MKNGLGFLNNQQEGGVMEQLRFLKAQGPREATQLSHFCAPKIHSWSAHTPKKSISYVLFYKKSNLVVSNVFE